jgi:zinc protease
VIDAILTMGDSARIRQDLVKGKKSVIQYEASLGWPFANPLDYRDPGDYALFLLYNPKFQAQEIVSQTQDEIARLQNEPVAVKEFERIKAQLRAERLKELESSLSRARALAQYTIVDGNPELINTELDAVLSVTPAQVQAAARKYLTTSQRAVLEIQPAPKEAK